MKPYDAPDSSRLPQNILVVEDSRTFASLLIRSVQSEFGITPKHCATYAETAAHLDENGADYFAALLDLNLPDAESGEVVDLVVGKNIPSIVFTGEVSDDLRDRMWAKRIIDYVYKENLENVQQVMDLLKRLQRNRGIKVLVADDSSLSRKTISELLQAWQFTVLEAADGRDALKTLHREGDIALLITDFNMPGMDGIALVKEARRTFSKNALPIIGLSGAGTATTSAHFIKAGANDYMHKPFLTEELYCRVRNTLEYVEHINLMRQMAEQDFLTGLYNRRSFFAEAGKAFRQSSHTGGPFVVAMIDIDHFKRCNDTFGHDAGDEVIKFVAACLKSLAIEGRILARFGGEEFCVACPGMDAATAATTFESLRSKVEETPIRYADDDIRVTVSVGVSTQHADSLEAAIIRADTLLYEAKNDGRNRMHLDANV